jgi:hypothetical protein
MPWKAFQRIADRYEADRRVRTLSCVVHFRVMAFARLCYRESLRDIEAYLSAQASKLYALDATTIDLYLSVLTWAPFRSTKAAIKLHTQLDMRGAIPSFIHISDGKMHDVNVIDLLIPEAGAFYVMDRGYLDFARLFALDQAGSLFVIRAKRNMDARRVYSAQVDRSTGLICDQQIAPNGLYAALHYPTHLQNSGPLGPSNADHSFRPRLM